MIGTQFLDEVFKSDSNINDYKPYFLDYEANKNEYFNSDYFEYKHETAGDIILFFVTVNGELSLRYDYIGNPDAINEIADAGDEKMIPVGALLNNKVLIPLQIDTEKVDGCKSTLSSTDLMKSYFFNEKPYAGEYFLYPYVYVRIVEGKEHEEHF